MYVLCAFVLHDMNVDDGGGCYGGYVGDGVVGCYGGCVGDDGGGGVACYGGYVGDDDGVACYVGDDDGGGCYVGLLVMMVVLVVNLLWWLC